MTLSESFAQELAKSLKDDPETLAEFYYVSEMRAWVKEQIDLQLDSDDMSKSVKAFIKRSLVVNDIMSVLQKAFPKLKYSPE